MSAAGTGQYEAVSGSFDATNSNNLDADGSYQATGKMQGSYRIVRAGSSDAFGLCDRHASKATELGRLRQA
jgi:hypothetical protein